MSAATVEQLVDQVRQLSEEERRLFHEKLAEIDDAEWQALRAEASRIADERGIDEEAITRAVMRHRYGEPSDVA
jgi:cell division protein FtsL